MPLDYQINACKFLTNMLLKSKRKLLVQQATGSGKSLQNLVIAKAMVDSLDRFRAIILHSNSHLCSHNFNKFGKMLENDCGLLGLTHQLAKPITYASIDKIRDIHALLNTKNKNIILIADEIEEILRESVKISWVSQGKHREPIPKFIYLPEVIRKVPFFLGVSGTVNLRTTTTFLAVMKDEFEYINLVHESREQPRPSIKVVTSYPDYVPKLKALTKQFMNVEKSTIVVSDIDDNADDVFGETFQDKKVFVFRDSENLSESAWISRLEELRLYDKECVIYVDLKWSRGTDFKTRYPTSAVIALIDPTWADCIQAAGRATRKIDGDVAIGVLVMNDSEYVNVDAAQIFTRMWESQQNHSHEDEYRAKLFRKCHTRALDPATAPESRNIMLKLWNSQSVEMLPTSSEYIKSRGKQAYTDLRSAMQYSGLRLSVKGEDAV